MGGLDTKLGWIGVELVDEGTWLREEEELLQQLSESDGKSGKEFDSVSSKVKLVKKTIHTLSDLKLHSPATTNYQIKCRNQALRRLT